MNKAQAAAVLITGMVLGVGGQALLKGSKAFAAPTRYQNSHLWVARFNTDDAGVRTPVYGGSQCSYVLSDDGGIAGDACQDLGELTPDQGTAFEAFLTSLGIAPPR